MRIGSRMIAERAEGLEKPGKGGEGEPEAEE